MFSLESPHQGNSNEYTKFTIFNIKKKKIILNYSASAAMGFSKGLENEFETAVVNVPSVFKPLKFYCSYYLGFQDLQSQITMSRTLAGVYAYTCCP